MAIIVAEIPARVWRKALMTGVLTRFAGLMPGSRCEDLADSVPKAAESEVEETQGQRPRRLRMADLARLGSNSFSLSLATYLMTRVITERFTLA